MPLVTKQTGNKEPTEAQESPECPTCFDLDMRFIPQPHKNPRTRSIGQIPRHWIDSKDLAKNRTCASCRLLKSAFTTLLNKGQLIDVQPGSKIKYSIAILDRDYHDYLDEDGMNKRKEATKYDPSSSLTIEMRCKPEGADDDEFQEQFKAEIYTRPGADPATWKAIGAAGKVPLDPSAEECAKIIKPWLKNCDKKHKVCQMEWQAGANGEPELLPLRVLDVSGDTVRLIKTQQGQRAHYIALSHCWGKEQLLTTTRETKTERMKGIPWEDLPKTFQDAIALTRSLGLQYIWIDSLCIIQLDKLDWEQQSAVMADIYSRCYLNIAATRAGGGNVGFLSPRWTERDSLEWADRFVREGGAGDEHTELTRTRKCPQQSFKIPGTTQHIYIRVAIDESHEALQTPRWIQSHAKSAPLLPRGWVYQERFLSPRTVHMHANEMVWVCNVAQRCECKTLDGTPPDGDGWSASKDRLVKLQDADSRTIHGLWRTIVEDFSLLDLTYETDRLPGLGGLAYRFAQHLPKNERYLAGLWEGTLARDLLWGSGKGQRTPGPPSWSWASRTGGSGAGIGWEYETKPKPMRSGGTVTYQQDSRTKVIDVSVEVDGENKYGIVKGGRLTIEGALCAVITTDSPRTEDSHPISLANVNSVKESILNSLHLEYDTPKADIEAGGTVYCLFIGSFSEIFDYNPTEPHVQLQGLILKPVAGENFERIGKWKQYIEDWVHHPDVWTKNSRVYRVSII